MKKMFSCMLLLFISMTLLLPAYAAFENPPIMHILQGADYTTTVSDHCFRACYQRRNEFMVNHSSLVIAVWNWAPSGTQNTIDYAKKRGIKAINIIE